MRVSGVDVHQYLHGLFTNNVVPGLDNEGAQYGCFLSTNGRVLFDAFLLNTQAKVDGKPAVLVDVHRSCAADVAEHLLEYRLRRKIKVENLESEMTVMVRTKGSEASDAIATSEIFDDPRNLAFGEDGLQRLYVPSIQASRSWNPPEYERLLLKCGVGEGPAVFVKEKTLPFEGNIDFLRAVSFDKGCYIGQELTHRTHVMLVTRKRTVPLTMDGASLREKGWGKVGEAIFADGVRVGHLQHVFEDRAVALMRLRYMNKESLTCGVKLENGATALASIPPWWEREEVEKILKQQDPS